MSTPRILVFLIACAPLSSWGQSPNLGQRIDPRDLVAWDIRASPDGSGLPPGSGTATQGAKIYAEKCVACHGENARGGSNVGLVGGAPIKNMDSARTIANFWPYSTTVFDFIRRAMPWQSPRTLSNDEVYALTAYILAENKLIGAGDVMNAQSLPHVKMPNRDGFILKFPDKI